MARSIPPIDGLLQNGPGGARCGGCVPLDAEFRRVAGLSQCTPHFSFGLAKRETGRARSKEKKRFGGSVCARADLLPPAGDGWQSLAAVRDGNALPLGRPSARGNLGYPLRRFSLPLAGC